MSVKESVLAHLKRNRQIVNKFHDPTAPPAWMFDQTKIPLVRIHTSGHVELGLVIGIRTLREMGQNLAHTKTHPLEDEISALREYGTFCAALHIDDDFNVTPECHWLSVLTQCGVTVHDVDVHDTRLIRLLDLKVAQKLAWQFTDRPLMHQKSRRLNRRTAQIKVGDYVKVLKSDLPQYLGQVGKVVDIDEFVWGNEDEAPALSRPVLDVPRLFEFGTSNGLPSYCYTLCLPGDRRVVIEATFLNNDTTCDGRLLVFHAV